MTKSNRSDKSKSSSSSSLLPIPATTLCFDKNEFMKESFSVDHFVADCRKRVQLEVLRQDLEVYFKLLKNAMIELINKDYADFVNLSSNLVGMEKAIGQLRGPLQEIRHEVKDVNEVINKEMKDFELALEKQKALSTRRKLLGHMQGLLQAIEKIEHIQRSEDSTMGQILERIAGEFNQLQHHTMYCKGLPVLNLIRPRISSITGFLQSSLEGELVKGMAELEATHIHRCLNSYALIGKTKDAEVLVRMHIVKPHMQQLMEEQHGDLTIPSLKSMFYKILNVVPNHLRLLCDITSGRKNRSGEQFRGIPGYDFVVNSAWPEIVSSLEQHLPELFASRDPNIFHKRYCTCMEFVDKFERQCGSQASITRLRQSEAFHALMTHWSLPVYFQIRFQSIGGQLESALTPEIVKTESEQDAFRLQASLVAWQSVQMCWSEDIFLPGLLHRFWKLTLQILSRYGTWVKMLHNNEVLNKSPSSTDMDKVSKSIAQISGLVIDLGTIFDKVKQIYADKIEPLAKKQGLKDTSILEDALLELLNNLTKYKEDFVNHMITLLSSLSVAYLKHTQDVPRLYRKTNRPAPTEPSQYVNGVIKPLKLFKEELHPHIDSSMVSDWITQIASTVSEKYYSVVTDVLTSVRKMEESLMRLQKMRSAKSSSGNLASLAGGSDALSDDDKIRLQLFLDVSNLGSQMKDCTVNLDSISSYQSLLVMVTEAKEKRFKAGV
uniref:Conserved oligomeric Golgi complex subunit 2 n=1 Tax=Phallusia mammillata TaxID=59560 RepID=A0A6F9DAA3_9ASCI|nr:conserved oligomeric Golgi complex subunit 2-like [Phallusia mammillata]